VLMAGLVVYHWHAYDSCQDPLNVWLVVDLLSIVAFRMVHFAFQYSRTVRFACCGRCLPKLLAILSLWIMYPFLWAWLALGVTWYIRSHHCIPPETGEWGYAAWMMFTCLYLLFFASLIYFSVRTRPALVLSAAEIQAILQYYQRTAAFALVPGAARSGLMQEEIDAMRRRPLTASDLIEEKTCSICLTVLRVDDVVRNVSCSHLFHADCLDQWLVHNDTCPLCRRPVNLAPGAMPHAVGEDAALLA